MSAGTIYWDPSVEVGVRDKVKTIRVADCAPMCPGCKSMEPGLAVASALVQSGTRKGDQRADVSDARDGACGTVLSDKEGYRAIKEGSGVRPDLEQLNTEAIEQPIIWN